MRVIGDRGHAAVVLALGAAVLAIAACGGSSSTRTRASSTATVAARTVSTPSAASTIPSTAPKAGLIAPAEAICERVNKAIDAGPAVGLDASKIASAAPKNVVLEAAALQELARLHPPAATAADWKRILEYRGRLAGELSELVRAARAGDAVRIRALAASKKLVHKQLSTLAVHDGFKACARVG
jgi:hypothetical protein